MLVKTDNKEKNKAIGKEEQGKKKGNEKSSTDLVDLFQLCHEWRLQKWEDQKAVEAEEERRRKVEVDLY